MLIGLFGAIFTFFLVAQRTLVPYRELLRWFALLAFAGNLLPKRCYAAAMGMDRVEWFWFNLLAPGPMLLCGALWLNFLLRGPETRVVVPGAAREDIHLYWQMHGELPVHRPWEEVVVAGPDDLVIGLADGALGWTVITSQARVVRQAEP